MKKNEDEFLSKFWQQKAKKENLNLNQIKAFRVEDNNQRVFLSFDYDGIELITSTGLKSDENIDNLSLEELIEQRIIFHKKTKDKKERRLNVFYEYLCGKCAIDHSYLVPKVIGLQKTDLGIKIKEASNKDMTEYEKEASIIAPLMVKHVIKQENN